jgi:hypothetical protein
LLRRYAPRKDEGDKIASADFISPAKTEREMSLRAPERCVAIPAATFQILISKLKTVLVTGISMRRISFSFPLFGIWCLGFRVCREAPLAAKLAANNFYISIVSYSVGRMTFIPLPARLST